MKKSRFPWKVLMVAILAMCGFALFESRSGELYELESECSEFKTVLSDDFSFTGDFNRCSRAKCSAEFFDKFRIRHGFVTPLVNVTPLRTSGWSFCQENWWSPPQDYSNTFFKTKRNERILLAYKDHYIYYDISVW